MGLCSGRCFSRESLNFTSMESDGQDISFMDCDTTTENQTSPSPSLFGILKFKTKHHSKFLNRFWRRHKRQQQSAVSQTAVGGPSYARLNTSRRNTVSTLENQNYGKMVLPKDVIQLQCLDVGSLLKMNERRDYKRLQCDSLTEGTLSFAGSSLDLEWEHEYDAIERQQSQDEAQNSWYNSDEESSSSSSDGKGHSIELSQFSSPTNRLNRQNNNYQPISMNTNSMRWHSRQRRKNLNRSTSTTKLDHNIKMKKTKNLSHTSTPDSLEWDVHEDDHKFKSEEDSLDQETVELLNEIEWLKNRALIETGDTQWNTNTHHDES
ncbi:uncharacterized protein LOC116344109 [Contarinia nasturtii]|uniref:uncharacterized protein LOC116344109 n=1 Tax=Contarinia nasturtii TaxID=265458 RepID=UPI0012D441E7|nr:uncharacterized protein LOC116344109 [Contarinia nasturtii]